MDQFPIGSVVTTRGERERAGIKGPDPHSSGSRWTFLSGPEWWGDDMTDSQASRLIVLRWGTEPLARLDPGLIAAGDVPEGTIVVVRDYVRPSDYLGTASTKPPHDIVVQRRVGLTGAQWSSSDPQRTYFPDDMMTRALQQGRVQVLTLGPAQTDEMTLLRQRSPHAARPTQAAPQASTTDGPAVPRTTAVARSATPPLRRLG